MQVLMIRHGRPETKNGASDPDLCEVGRKQARDLSAVYLDGRPRQNDHQPDVKSGGERKQRNKGVRGSAHVCPP